MEKRGQELSVGTLIIIVLGVVVLVLLILGFSIGWENLFAKIGIVSGDDLSAMVAACKVAAASNSQASYCEFKKVRIDGVAKEINCEFSNVDSVLGNQKLACPTSLVYKTGSKGEKP